MAVKAGHSERIKKHVLAFEMKGLGRKRFCGFRGQQDKPNEWVLNTAGVKRHRQSKEASILWSHHEVTRELQGNCLEKEIMRGTMPGARRRGRPRTAWMDNIKTWTGLSVEESVRMTEDGDKRRKYVHGVANPRMEDG